MSRPDRPKSTARTPETAFDSLFMWVEECRPNVDMTEVDCPVDGCDYSGEASSVEAHISSSTDDGHSGKAGSEYREELQGDGPAEEEPEESDGPEPMTADDLAETAEQDDEGDTKAYLLIGGAVLLLYLIGSGSNSGGPANV